ncbi:hypothetical protein BDP55DRAFT_638695 [Colletotrichum godetiae]|uniref:Ankyrin repeat protein n=1 Tax=Colletotrichum godetiae TaxID=1209918 RepID=A0AAJ0A6M4_9PEZI|nr:uncharacterized protein BDP55DRAFT_638695 [Colletotrichum godetiae]KAK1657440.1 hypothetical protein BDP55DRAFT_638695 [Colletotrichum godetiae]
MSTLGLQVMISCLSFRTNTGSVPTPIKNMTLLVEWLLEHGADPNMCDKKGFSPLHYAVFWLDARAIELLLHYGARIKRKDELKVINALLSGIYTRKHHEESQCNSLHPSMWVRMVQNVDLHLASSHYIGSSCIEHWQPGTSLPACTVHREYHSWWISERKEQLVHPELVKRWGGLRKALRGVPKSARGRSCLGLGDGDVPESLVSERDQAAQWKGWRLSAWGSYGHHRATYVGGGNSVSVNLTSSNSSGDLKA